MLKKLLLLSGMFIAVVLAALWASPRGSEATTWAPFFGPPNYYSIEPTTTSARSDIRAQYNVFEPSANFSGLFGRAITFGDAAVTTASAADLNLGPNGVGSYIGSLT